MAQLWVPGGVLGAVFLIIVGMSIYLAKGRAPAGQARTADQDKSRCIGLGIGIPGIVLGVLMSVLMLAMGKKKPSGFMQGCTVESTKFSSRWHMYRPRVKDVKGDNNCFFRALFHAARSTGDLQQLARCLAVGKDSSCWDTMKEVARGLDARNRTTDVFKETVEDVFVDCLRQAVADQVQFGSGNGMVRGTYRTLQAYDAPTLSLVRQGLPHWMSAAFDEARALNPEDQADFFVAAVAQNIRTWSRFVGQIEVNLIKHMMDKCGGIKFRVVSADRTPDNSDPRLASRHGELVLVCIREQHYMFVV